jgi:S1-C subfamily serine protease
LLLLVSVAVQAAETAGQIYRKSVRATAQIQSSGGTGTGWVVSAEKKWLITADHVVNNDTRVVVVFPAFRDGRVISERSFYEKQSTHVTGRVVRVDSDRDLALIELDELPSGVQQLPLATGTPTRAVRERHRRT